MCHLLEMGFVSSMCKEVQHKGCIVEPISRQRWRWLLPIPIFFVILFLAPPQAQADGGAPNLAYVAGTAHGISSIDISQQKIVDTLPVKSRPDTILLSIDGRLLFVTQPEANKLIVIAPKTKQTICTQQIAGNPSLLTLDPGTDILYVAGNGAAIVTGIDPTTCRIVRTLHTQSGVYGLAVATVGSGISGGSGNQIWVAGIQGLTIFDGKGTQQATLPISGRPLYLCIPFGQTVYVVTQQGNVEAIDLTSHHVLPPLLTGSHFGPMDYNALTGQIYVPDLDRQRIDVLAPVSIEATQPVHQPIRTIAFDATPQSIAITSDGQFGFVALENGTVAMLDLPGRQVITTFHVGGSPRFIITGLYPTLFSLTPQQSTVLSWLANASHYLAIGAIAIVTLLLILMPKPRRPQPEKENDRNG
jgi:DNA-binding beta-propeller fold protein YncE